LRDTLNRETNKEVLKRIKALGYDGVEFAGFYQTPASEMHTLLEQFGLSAVASHTSIHELLHSFDDLVLYNKTIGNSNIVIPYVDIKDQTSYEQFLPLMKQLVNQLTKAGMNVFYHNHAHEFVKFDDQFILDHLLDDIPSLKLEFDVFWAVFAGVDPYAYIIKRQDRTRLLHAKDMDIVDGKKEFASVGHGVIDFKLINELSTNIDCWIVENDLPKDGGFKTIEESIIYIKQIL
ncbi:MAG: sugar phosphate isomerase/epimerase, partial [Acholeplasmataceae bacterium]|nr:sugar phosphate isomerase/epimerase [Acholeplasmataceae bacterium]